MNPSLDTSSVWSRHPKSKESESTASFQIHGGGLKDFKNESDQKKKFHFLLLLFLSHGKNFQIFFDPTSMNLK